MRSTAPRTSPTTARRPRHTSSPPSTLTPKAAPAGPSTSAAANGRNALYLAAQGYLVRAFDPSAVAIEKLRGYARELGVEVSAEVADMMTYPYGTAAYDLLVASNVLVHATTETAPELVGRWIEGLAPGGLIYVSVFTTEDPAASETSGFVDTFFEPAAFRGYFAGLTLLRSGVEDYYDESHGPGHYHQTARYVGRKPGLTQRVRNRADRNRHHLVMVGGVEALVDGQDLGLPRLEGRRVASEAHGPFELRIAGADLVLVRPVVAPEAVGRRRRQYRLVDAERAAQFVDLSLRQIGDGG